MTIGGYLFGHQGGLLPFLTGSGILVLNRHFHLLASVLLMRHNKWEAVPRVKYFDAMESGASASPSAPELQIRHWKKRYPAPLGPYPRH